MLRAPANFRLFSSTRSVRPMASTNSALARLRGAHLERSRLMSIIWRDRSSPNTLNIPDLQRIRRQSTTILPRGDKRMSDSFLEISLPFLEDNELRAEYISFLGGLRFGKLMEDLDALAASIAYLYCDDDPNLTLLTAAVDRIDLLKTFDRIANTRLRGMVTYVGRTSMEITMSIELDEHGNGSWELGALAKFLFVARSKDGKEAVPVPRLIAETKGEKELVKLGTNRHAYRLRRNETSLFRQPPTEAESQLLHQLLIASSTDSIPMKNTQCSSIRICHPQERNVHNLIFGGYLMREAFELAYSSAIIHNGGEPIHIVTVEDINFVHPVAIGSILEFSATIIYTDRVSDKLCRMHVEVIADVIDPKTGGRLTTNTFHYTFTSQTTRHIMIIPTTYTEAMKYLEGKRRIEL